MTTLLDQPDTSTRTERVGRVKSAALAVGAGLATGLVVGFAVAIAGRWA
jgi:hypothetical protein